MVLCTLQTTPAIYKTIRLAATPRQRALGAVVENLKNSNAYIFFPRIFRTRLVFFSSLALRIIAAPRMTDSFVVLERTELAEGDFLTVTGNMGPNPISNQYQYVAKNRPADSGALCSIVLGKMDLHNGRTTPPVRLSLRDSIGLNKGDTITIDADGPIVTDFHRFPAPKSLPSFPELHSDWESNLLGNYYPVDSLVVLSATQQHEVYSWLCCEPLYLVFYPLFGLPRLDHNQYTQAMQDFQPQQDTYTDEMLDFALRIMLDANDRWRHGYTPHLEDIRINHSPMRVVVTQILQRVHVSFNRNGWMCWPYPQQVEQRVSDMLSQLVMMDGTPSYPEQPASVDPEISAAVELLRTGGVKVLRVESYGVCRSDVSTHLNELWQLSLNVGVSLMQCGSCTSLERLYESVSVWPAVILIDVHVLPLFAVLQLVRMLLSCPRSLICLHYDASFDSSTVRYLESAQHLSRHCMRVCAGSEYTTAPDYSPSFGLASPCLYMPGVFDPYAVVPGMELYRNAISLLPENELGLAIGFYANRRQADLGSWEFAFAVATDKDKRRVMPNLWQATHGTRSYLTGVRCCPNRDYFLSPCVCSEPGHIGRSDSSGITEKCDDLQQMECVTLDEMGFQVVRLIYFSSIPITYSVFRKLLALTTTSLIIITNNENLEFMEG